MVDRVEDASGRRAAAPRSRAARFSARVRTISCAPGPVISWFQSRTSCSTVIEGKVAGSTWWGTRPSTSAALAVTTPRAGPRRRRWPSPSTATSARNSATPEQQGAATPPRRRSIAGSAALSGRAVPRRQQPIGDRAAGAHDGQPAEQRDLGPELVGLRRHQQRAGHGDEEAERDPADAPGRHGLRVRDHEEQEDEDLGRRDDHPPVVEAAHGRERPAGDHAVARRREHADAGGEGDPERHRGGEEPEASGDQQPADEDDGVGHEHPGSRAAPTRSRAARPLRAPEHDEHDDEPDVRRVEHVRAAVADEVLGHQRERGDAGEHVPARGCSSGRPAACPARGGSARPRCPSAWRWPATRRPGGLGT